MSMISFAFLGLVILVFIVLAVSDKMIKDDDKAIKVSDIILLISSYIFLAYADWKFAAVLLILTIITWFSAGNEKIQKYGIITAVLALVFFKYSNFFAESFSKIIGSDFTARNIIIPIGISYYSFSAISYIIDVSHGKTKKRGFLDVALYLSFFPKITSGPVQRSDDFFSQTEKRRNVGWNTFAPGIQIFVFGLFKKIVLADRLSVFVNQVYDTPLAFGSFTVFLASVSYSLQIYFDFSGYSDMAIGVGKILGIEMPKNFNLPYLSHNVTEFWKRWHITFSSWLQDYLYIPLGGNRKGKARMYINLMITMIIGGFWHGANFTYIIWGGLHGAALAVHKFWMNITESNAKKHSVLANAVSACITFLFINFCWIFFRAESVKKALMIITRIFSFKPGLEQPYIWLFASLAVLFAACISAFVKTKNKDRKIKQKKMNFSIIEGYYPLVDLTTFRGLVIFFVFFGLLICYAYTGGSPFIYGNY